MQSTSFHSLLSMLCLKSRTGFKGERFFFIHLIYNNIIFSRHARHSSFGRNFSTATNGLIFFSYCPSPSGAPPCLKNHPFRNCWRNIIGSCERGLIGESIDNHSSPSHTTIFALRDCTKCCEFFRLSGLHTSETMQPRPHSPCSDWGLKYTLSLFFLLCILTVLVIHDNENWTPKNSTKNPTNKLLLRSWVRAND